MREKIKKKKKCQIDKNSFTWVEGKQRWVTMDVLENIEYLETH